jgi:ribosomal-protein-alanine N-acetyltransferase
MKILETSRLILREFCAEDADALARVLSDAETMRYYPAAFDRAGVEQWIGRNMKRYADRGFGLWAMILKGRDELIGDCGLTLQNVDGKDEIEIGYHVRRDLWGRGLATEAARACRDLGLGRFSAERLISLIRPENLASRRVAEKNGMTVWKEVIWRNLPHLVYAIHREEIVGSAAGRRKWPGLWKRGYCHLQPAYATLESLPSCPQALHAKSFRPARDCR